MKKKGLFVRRATSADKIARRKRGLGFGVSQKAELLLAHVCQPDKQ